MVGRRSAAAAALLVGSRLEMISVWLLCWKLLRATAGFRRTAGELTDGNHDDHEAPPPPGQPQQPVAMEIGPSLTETENLDSWNQQEEELRYPEGHGAKEPIEEEDGGRGGAEEEEEEEEHEEEWRRRRSREEEQQEQEEEPWRRRKEAYDTVLVSPGHSITYSVPDVPDRCVSSPSSPSRTRKMERSSRSCDHKFPPSSLCSLPRRPNAMALRWEASLLANQKKE